MGGELPFAAPANGLQSVAKAAFRTVRPSLASDYNSRCQRVLRGGGKDSPRPISFRVQSVNLHLIKEPILSRGAVSQRIKRLEIELG